MRRLREILEHDPVEDQEIETGLTLPVGAGRCDGYATYPAIRRHRHGRDRRGKSPNCGGPAQLLAEPVEESRRCFGIVTSDQEDAAAMNEHETLISSGIQPMTGFVELRLWRWGGHW